MTVPSASSPLSRKFATVVGAAEPAKTTPPTADGLYAIAADLQGRERFQQAAARLKGRGWHIQVYAGLTVVSAIKDLVLDSPVPVVFDHFGGARAALGVDQPGFADLLELVRRAKAYVKLSAAYRASTLAPDYPDVIPFAKALIAANAGRTYRCRQM